MGRSRRWLEEVETPHRTLRFRTLIIVAAAVASLVAPGASLAAPTEEGSPKRAENYRLQWNMKAMAAHALFTSRPEVRGDTDILAAVVDTGIDYLHPDLGIRRNADGSAGDGGLVDLKLSTSLLGLTPSGTTCPTGDPGIPYRKVAPATNGEDAWAVGLGRDPSTDFHSHGTAVAGLIASQGGLLAGVTQRTTLFSVKVHGASRQNCLSVYLAGIRYAADQGADVIHLSIPLEFPRAGNDAAVENATAALEYAHAKGAVLVAAAGNATTNLDDLSRFRFCQGAHVICVGATGPASADTIDEPFWDEIASYSNFGAAIDVVGPGGTGTFPNQIVPVWLTCSQVTVVMTGAPGACSRGDKEIWASTGTSFGAAATSGLAALLKSIRPAATPDEIETLITSTADDYPAAPGEDPYYGSGRINVIEAVIAAQH